MDGEDDDTLFKFAGLPGFEMSREELKRLRKREYLREYNRKRKADPAYRERERERERKRRADPAKRERERERERKRRADPAYRERERERGRKRRADPAFRERQRHSNRKSMYGLTPSEHQDYLLKQKGVCAICERPEKLKIRGVTISLSVDHCHETEEAHGKKFAVRGLLCFACNRVLARATAQRDWFKKAKKYIEDFENGLELKLAAAGIEHDPFA